MTVDNGEISHVVNLFGCKNSTILVKGKVNAVTIGVCFQVDLQGSWHSMGVQSTA